MILSIDLGTSSVKGAVFLDNRPLHDLGRVVYKRQDAQSWLVAIRALLTRLAWSERADIESIVISGQGPTVVPVLQNGEILKPQFYYQKGSVMPPDKDPIRSYFLPKVAYLLKQKPYLASSVQYFMSAPDFIAYWLTGEAVTSLPNEAYHPLVWSEQEIVRYGFPLRWFPPYTVHSEIGILRPDLQKELMLPRKVVVYTTMFDFLAALLGSGSIHHGDVVNRAGMSEGVNFVMNYKPDVALLPQTTAFWRISPHIIPEYYNVGVVFDKVGELLESHSYDASDPQIVEHVHNITRIWNEMEAVKVTQVRLCGGQIYYPEISALKKSLSSPTFQVLNFAQPELIGNAMYGAWMRGYHKSLSDSVHEMMLSIL